MDEIFDYPKSQHPEFVELPEEKAFADRPILTAQVGNLPLEIEARLKVAHFQGRLKESLAHWTGALTAAQIVDQPTINTLNKLSGEITGIYPADKPVLDKIRQVFIALRTTKR
jgi:hypothetical protein